MNEIRSGKNDQAVCVYVFYVHSRGIWVFLPPFYQGSPLSLPLTFTCPLFWAAWGNTSQRCCLYSMDTREGFDFSSLPSTFYPLSPTHLYLSSPFLSCMSQYVTTVLFSWDLGLKKPNSLLLPYYYQHRNGTIYYIFPGVDQLLCVCQHFGVIPKHW